MVQAIVHPAGAENTLDPRITNAESESMPYPTRYVNTVPRKLPT